MVAAGYLAALICLARWAHGGWPPADSAGLWFYSAAVAVLLAVFLSEPFYTTPKAVLASSGGLFLFALTADRQGMEASKEAVSAGRTFLLVFSGAVFVMAAVAIFTRERAPRLNALAFPIAVTFGSGSILFGTAYVFSVYGSFAKSPKTLAVLLASALAFTWSPFERVAGLITRVRSSRRLPRAVVIERVQDPATAIARAPERTLSVGDALAVSDGAIGVVVDVTATADRQSARIAFPKDVVLRPGDRLKAPAEKPGGDPVIGYVAPGSAMNAIRVAAPASISKLNVEEGCLLSAPVRDQDVLFQITGAAIQEEVLGDETHERFRIDAQKLGKWDAAQSAFDLIPWLPDPGTAVRLKTREQANFEATGIGFVPGSRYVIRYRPAPAVTHNTAILGILGSGKTTLARELTCRNIADGIKVLVLDITGQYAPFFDSLVPSSEAAQRLEDINGRLAAHHASRTRDADGYFGSRGEFSRQIRADIDEFLQGDDPTASTIP